MKEKLEYLLMYANTLLCLAKNAQSLGNKALMRNYAKQGKKTCQDYIKLRDVDKTSTYIEIKKGA